MQGASRSPSGAGPRAAQCKRGARGAVGTRAHGKAGGTGLHVRGKGGGRGPASERGEGRERVAQHGRENGETKKP
jgi:hypothetical protein